MRFDIGRPTEAFRQALKDQVDAGAETARGRFLTAGSGQALEYEQSRQEAEAYKAAGYPSPINGALYPFTKAQMDAFGQTGQVAADAILAQSATWVTASAAIKRVRLTAKVAIDAATSMAGARTALADATAQWPTP